MKFEEAPPTPNGEIIHSTVYTMLWMPIGRTRTVFNTSFGRILRILLYT